MNEKARQGTVAFNASALHAKRVEQHNVKRNAEPQEKTASEKFRRRGLS
jgi:hypothetical protein